MSHHILKIETKFARLSAMNDPVLELIQVAILISPLSVLTEYAAMTALINTKNADETNWNHGSMALTQKQ